MTTTLEAKLRERAISGMETDISNALEPLRKFMSGFTNSPIKLHAGDEVGATRGQIFDALREECRKHLTESRVRSEIETFIQKVDSLQEQIDQLNS